MDVRKLLWPVSLLYDAGTRIRNGMFEAGILKETTFSIPVISVGNLSMGGTGKTPHIEYLIQLLKSNCKVAVLSRGYGRTTKGFREVSIASSSDECGDEPLQIKTYHKDVAVFVCEDRVTGIQKIIQDIFPDVILLDDAFQHRYVKPSLNILLTDYAKPFFNDTVLPSGNLREASSAFKRADIIIVTKCPEYLPETIQSHYLKSINPLKDQQVYFTGLHYHSLVSANSSADLPTSSYPKVNCILLTGIANPELLIQYAEKQFHSVNHMEFNDHHRYSESDFKKIEEKFNNIASPSIIVTTSKDYMRIKGHISHLPVYILPVEATFLLNAKNQFDQYIINHVRKN